VFHKRKNKRKIKETKWGKTKKPQAERILPELHYKAHSSGHTDAQTLSCLQGWMTPASPEL